MTKDLQERTLFAGLALVIFLPVLFVGGLLLQIGIGLLAMLGVHELLHMKGLKTMTIEGTLTLLATFALTIPLENYLTFLPVDGNVVAYSVLITIMLGTTVFSKSSTIEDLTGVNFGKHKLAPRVSPNKSIEGFVGGILGAVLITVLFMLVDSTVALPYGIYRMSLFAAFFSVAGQFGDLIESAMKRHFGVKDSGKFIPGHGGVLDRFDSMLVVFPIMHLFGLF